MAGIQLSGLSSGLDTESLIQGLMSVERAPRARITLQQSALHARQEGLQAVEDKLKALKLASDDLGSFLTWNPVQTRVQATTVRPNTFVSNTVVSLNATMSPNSSRTSTT